MLPVRRSGVTENRIFFKLWKATKKLNFLSDRWLHHFVGILPLTVVPPYSPRFLALVKNTIRCENFFNEKCFTTLSGAHHEKWKFMSKHNSGYALVFRETSLVNLGLLSIQCWGFSVSLTAAIFRFRSLLLSFSVCNTWGKRRDTTCVISRLFLDPENTAAFSHCFLSWLDALDVGDHSRRVTLACPHTGQSLLNYTASLPHEDLQHTEGNKLISCLYSFANQIWCHH